MDEGVIDLRTLEHGGVEVLHVSGSLDSAVVPVLLPRVPAVVAGAAGVVLDLSDVTRCDTSSARLVDRLARECARAHAGFRVVAPPGSAGRRVLDLVGMSGGLVVDDLPSALEVVRGAGADGEPG